MTNSNSIHKYLVVVKAKSLVGENPEELTYYDYIDMNVKVSKDQEYYKNMQLKFEGLNGVKITKVLTFAEVVM